MQKEERANHSGNHRGNMTRSKTTKAIFICMLHIVFYNNVVDSSYSMLLWRPWLRDVKMAHDWGNNIVTIQRNGIIRTIRITKHLGGEVRRP
jgi:hypothetical protein